MTIAIEGWVNRVADGNLAYYISDRGHGFGEWGLTADGIGYGNGDDEYFTPGGSGDGYGYSLPSTSGPGGDGNADGHDTQMGGEYYLPVSCAECSRTERVFLCAGCIGGYECSIHGRRL